MKSNDWKERLNIVYSTNPDFNYQTEENEESETIEKNKQKLRVSIEKKGRGGKTVTLITGFVGKQKDIHKPSDTNKKTLPTIGQRFLE